MFVINTLGAGGAEKHLLSLTKNFMAKGDLICIAVLTRDIKGGAKNLKRDFIELGVEIFELNYCSEKYFRDFGRWYLLIRLITRWSPEIVHSHLPRADFSVSLAKRLLRSFFWVTTIHDAYNKNTYSGFRIFDWAGWNWRIADHIITVSGHAKQWLESKIKPDQRKVTMVHHGINFNNIQSNISLKYNKKKINAGFKIGCLARFEPRKGISTLIEAMEGVRAKFPTAKLIIAGSDPKNYSLKLRALVNALNLNDAVEIQSFSKDPVVFLSRLDVFAFASTSEGFGLVLLEAMAVGLPIVASNIHPINFIIEDKITGFLVNPKSPAEFSSAIISCLSDRKLSSKMGQAGKLRCRLNFSEERMIQSISDIYFDLLS
ncbi:RfaG Glycosyltransferase [Candidatus Methylopumilus universalis]